MKQLLTGEQSNRLLFRTIVSSDYNTWIPFYKKPLCLQYWNGLTTAPMVACQEQFDAILERYVNGLHAMHTLIYEKTNRLIELCRLLVQTIDKTLILEIDYSILRAFWSNDYATKAA
ncbi:MAG: ribosomal-protein-alanine N-acetyltransferase [Maribacter sp.]|jgi:RimJ/RimL family protein N-acetyltransferase